LRRSSALVLCALACTRTSAPPPPPAPASVDPPGTYAGREQAVLLRGDRFTPAAVQQLGGGSHIAVDYGFRAFLGSVELQQVRFIDSHTLAAVVPADLPAGMYDLTLEGPYGSGSASAVFQAVAAIPPALAPSVTAPARVLVGSDVTVTVDVGNPGGMTALAVSAGAAIATGPAITLQPPAGAFDIAGGTSHAFTWHLQASAPGVVDLTLPFSGVDEVDGTAIAAQAHASIEVVTPAHLALVSSSAPSSQPAGPTFTLSVEVRNDGGADALGVHFDPLTGTSLVEVVATPDAQDIPAGATRTFTWVVRGVNEGTAVLGTAATATDAVGGQTIALPPLQWTVIIFKVVALLYPTLTVPPGVLPAETFAVTFRLDNPGIVDALNVTANIALSGSGSATLQSAPPSTPVNVSAGQSTTFTWTYTAAANGSVQFDLSASGTDARSGNPVNAAATATTVISDAAPVAADPFADGARALASWISLRMIVEKSVCASLMRRPMVGSSRSGSMAMQPTLPILPIPIGCL